MQLGTQLPPVGVTEGASATQQKTALSEGKETSFDAVMLDGASTEPAGADVRQGEVAVLLPSTSPAMTYTSFSVVPELALAAMKGEDGETLAVEKSGKILPQIAELGATGSDISPGKGAIPPTLPAITEVISEEFQAGADRVKTEATPKAVRADTTSLIMGEAARDLDQGGPRKAPSGAEAMTPPPPRSTVGTGTLHSAEAHTEKRQRQTANSVDDQPRNTQVRQSPAQTAAANPPVTLVSQRRQEFDTRPVENSDAHMTQKAPHPLSASGSGVEKAFGSKIAPIETSGIAVSDRKLAETGEVSHSIAPSDTTSQYMSVRDTARFTVAGRLPETSEMALMQDGVMSVANVLSTSDPIMAEVGSDIAMTEMRAAETLTARAEVSAQLRAELPRHIAQQLADVARTMPDRPIELTLSPEELGRLRLTFTGDLSAMSVSVSVERPETLDLMRRHIEILAQEMREIGYGEVTFSFEQSGSEAGGQSNDAQTSSDHENQHLNPTGISSELPPSPVRLSMTGTSGVDIRL